MPHMVLEYTDNLIPLNVDALLNDLHTTLAKADFTEPERIKTRAIPLKQYLVGSKGNQGTMVHLTLSVMSGRETAELQRVGTLLFERLKTSLAAQGKECPTTFEIREMSSDTYFR